MFFKPDHMNATIRTFVKVPAHVNVCANMVRYDLLHGPCFARLSTEGIEAITDDDLASLYDDAKEMVAEDGGEVVEVYTSIIADTLHDYIDALPTLYYEPDCDHVCEHEPEGIEEDGEWFDPPDYHELDRASIVEALFGRTIAHEFR